MAATRGKGPTIDAWGRELTYSVDKDGVVTLGAYGTDGKGLNPYLTFRFRTRHADGSLIVGDGPIDWIGRAPTGAHPPSPRESDLEEIRGQGPILGHGKRRGKWDMCAY